jgi:hypothetical protein
MQHIRYILYLSLLLVLLRDINGVAHRPANSKGSQQSTTKPSGTSGKRAAGMAQSESPSQQSKEPLVVNEECEKRVPSSYTQPQKKQLCSMAADSTGGIGPAICASVAKQLLHGNVKFETILQLCQGSPSAAPVQCYDNMDATGSSNNALKSKYGLDLCTNAQSGVPGECFASISVFPGTNNRVKPDELLSFCRSLEDRAPLLCMQAVRDTGLVPAAQALDACQQVVGASGLRGSAFGGGAAAAASSNLYGDFAEASGHAAYLNRAAGNCIRAMHSQVRTMLTDTQVECRYRHITTSMFVGDVV